MIDHDAIRVLGDIPTAEAAARAGQVAGKVLRRELRAPYWRGHARAVG